MSHRPLFLSGIRASGHHGARPGEKDEPQPFVVDLDLDVDVAADAIDATADYRGISEAVRAVIEDGSFDLIEVMARTIAAAVLSIDHVRRVTAVVHKPNAATRLEIDGVAAAVTLESLIGGRDRVPGTRVQPRGPARDPAGGGRRTRSRNRASRSLACSRVWETDPVGGPPQPDFLNVVIRLETDLTPFELLEACQRVERGAGA